MRRVCFSVWSSVAYRSLVSWFHIHCHIFIFIWLLLLLLLLLLFTLIIVNDYVNDVLNGTVRPIHPLLRFH